VYKSNGLSPVSQTTGSDRRLHGRRSFEFGLNENPWKGLAADVPESNDITGFTMEAATVVFWDIRICSALRVVGFRRVTEMEFLLHDCAETE
jgi:hypothetical protein